MCETGSKQFD